MINGKTEKLVTGFHIVERLLFSKRKQNMTWYTLFNKLRKMTFKDTQSSKVYAVLKNPATGKAERLMLTLKYDAKGNPYLIKE